jgi:hypothetical protein
MTQQQGKSLETFYRTILMVIVSFIAGLVMKMNNDVVKLQVQINSIVDLQEEVKQNKKDFQENKNKDNTEHNQLYTLVADLSGVQKLQQKDIDYLKAKIK